MVYKVIVASANPVKVNATQKGFEKMFPNMKFTFHGVSVLSGVSDQPMSSAETLEGAENRIKSASLQHPEADFWIGIEGGLDRVGNEMEAFAWIAIQSRTVRGKARTGSFFLPQPVIDLINEGKEMGEADDIVFGHSNSKQKNGAVGILTGNVSNRTSYYSEAVILALIPFKNENLYKSQ